MKKNISINISGIIFHIEEDGYDKLKNYLDSINKYFASYEDSMEIIADIEGRIAEIFLSKLKDGKQVISLDDVNNLVATMGSVSDFQAIEEKEEPASNSLGGTPQPDDPKKEYTQPVTPPAKKLVRDGRRKIIGGVAAGIANYFNIDPFWIRLIFVLLFFNIFINISLGGPLFLIYIALWIILPESFSLEEDKGVKKLYRNPDDKILGGVSSGIAAYFAIDPTIIRLLFIIFIFVGGSGIIAYIILWAITPEAKSLTDKMQMQGEPVTLTNIETNIKKSFNVKENEEENMFVKILLFPFRLIAGIFKALGSALGPVLHGLLEIARVIAGLAIFLIALGLMVGLFIGFGTVLGLFFTGDLFYLPDLPLEQIKNIIPPSVSISGLVTIFIPLLLVAILGLSIIAKRSFINQSFGWAIFGIWVISIIIFSFSIPGAVGDFKRDGTFKVTETFEPVSGKLLLKVKETGHEDYKVTSLTLRGHDGNMIVLEKKFNSRGRNRDKAIENAGMVVYNVVQRDSIIIFDSNIQFEENTPFRFQTLEMTMFLPYNQKFVIEDGVDDILKNTIHRAGYTRGDILNNTWVFKPESGLECLTCSSSRRRNVSEKEIKISGFTENLELKDFTKVDASGYMELFITQGLNYSVKLNGRERDVENMKVAVKGNTLEISPKMSLLNWRSDRKKKVTVLITMPELKYADVSGAIKANFSGFNTDRFELDLAGASTVDLDMDVKDLDIDVAGASTLKIKGKGDKLKLQVAGASKIDAFDFLANEVDVDAVGASKVNISAEKYLKADATGASNIIYKGNPEVNSSTNFASSVKKY
jgi:phage shock protein PspC (stress-responsive transcriptional regulator)